MDTERAQSVLESLSAPSTTTPPRPRLNKFKVSKPKQEHHHPTISYFKSISSKRIHSPEPELQSPKPQTFQPFSRQQLLQRIKTFQSPGNWGYASLKLSLTPLEISRYGWNCAKNNELRCVSCHGRIHIKFPEASTFVTDDADDEVDEEYYESVLEKLCEKYRLELSQSHGKNCAWRQVQTPLSSYELNVDGGWLEKFKAQVGTIHGAELSTKSIEGEDVLIKWCDENNVEYESVDILRTTLLGWKLTTLQSNVLCECESCGRRFFKTDDEIDLIDQHNDWCCYVKGYLKIIGFMKSLSKKNQDHNDEEHDETLQRLDKLRKIIF